jgi:hypothetical protein
MADINSVIDQLSPEELDLLNSDPQMLAAFKAKHMAPANPEGDPNDPHSMAFERSGNYPASSYTTFAPSADVAMLASAAPGIVRGGTALLSQTPELLQGAGKIASKGIGMLKAPLAEGAAKVGDVLAPSVESADKALMEKLAQHGLKDVKPTVFNSNERDAIVNYADTMKKLADADKLSPTKLQEIRATLKDVLDNRLIAKASPTGQTVSQAKDAATAGLKRALPDVGESLDTMRRAYEAQGTKEALKSAAKKAIMVGLGGAAAGLGLKSVGH